MKLFNAIQREIIQKRKTIHRTIKNTKKLPSKILGDLYEDIIRTYTIRFLPNIYEIYTGLIASEEEGEIIRVSKELDLIIIDSRVLFPLFSASNLIITDPKPVKCVIQVKSEITTDTIKNSKENLESVKNLGNIPTILIGFKSRITKSINKHIGKEIDEIFFFSKQNGDLIEGQFEKYIYFLKRNILI